jgi:hypothetical protein
MIYFNQLGQFLLCAELVDQEFHCCFLWKAKVTNVFGFGKGDWAGWILLVL